MGEEGRTARAATFGVRPVLQPAGELADARAADDERRRVDATGRRVADAPARGAPVGDELRFHVDQFTTSRR